jgi:hypothetical protein
MPDLTKAAARSAEIKRLDDCAQGVAARCGLLMIRLADGIRARLSAGTGIPATLPQVTMVPRELLANPNCEHEIIDDLSTFAATNYGVLTEAGLQSLLRVPIRLDGQFALVCLAKTPARLLRILRRHQRADRIVRRHQVQTRELLQRLSPARLSRLSDEDLWSGSNSGRPRRQTICSRCCCSGTCCSTRRA